MRQSGGEQTSTKLYSPELLSLAVELASYPYSGNLARSFEARSQTCGSVVNIEVACDAAGAAEKAGIKVSACAVGQAACAIMIHALPGKNARRLSADIDQIDRWLAGDGGPPDWRGFDVLLPVLPHKGRHNALLLPWQAAHGALSMIATPS